MTAAQPAPAGTRLVDNPELNRFEAWQGGDLAGFASYRVSGDSMAFTHTVVEPAFEGRGVGSGLARFGLDEARSRGFDVKPVCPFIRSWIERHPDYTDLVADDA
jgi:predicted GNAT family acetyltransferase